MSAIIPPKEMEKILGAERTESSNSMRIIPPAEMDTLLTADDPHTEEPDARVARKLAAYRREQQPTAAELSEIGKGHLPARSLAGAIPDAIPQPADAPPSLGAGRLDQVLKDVKQRGVRSALTRDYARGQQDFRDNIKDVIDATKIEGVGPMFSEIGWGAGAGVDLGADTQAIRSTRALGETADAERLAWEQARGPKVETANLAKDLKMRVAPAELSGGEEGMVAHTIRSVTSDQPLHAKSSIWNSRQVDALGREDLKLPAGTPWSKKAVKHTIEENGKVYDELNNLQGQLKMPEEYTTRIQQLPGQYTEAAKLYPEAMGYPKVDPLIEELSVASMEPSHAVALLRRLRERSSNLLDKAAGGNAADLEMGKVYRRAAGALESALEYNLKGTGLYERFVEARRNIARAYDYLPAVEEATGSLNAQTIAKLYAEDEPLSGNIGKIGRLAVAYPEYFAPVSKAAGKTSGSGMGAWGRATEAAGIQSGFRQILTRWPHWKNVGGEVKAPPALPTTPGKLPQEIPPQGQLPMQLGEQGTQGELFGGGPKEFAQPQQPTPLTASGTGERTGSTQGIPMQRGPAGLIRPEEAVGSKATRATIETGGTPPPHQSLATRSADELIQGRDTVQKMRAVVDAMPEFKTLSERELTERMLDRKWVSDTLHKVREKQKGFEEIGARSRDAEVKQQMLKNREMMLDAAEQLEEVLRKPRPTPSPQGPKTLSEKSRAFLMGGE